MLLQEERHIIKWLSQYRTLEKRQIELMLNAGSPSFAERTLSRLCREGYIFKENIYVSMEPDFKRDQKLIDAVWVLLQFSKDIEPMAHYPAQYPSQVFFMKGENAYEIAVFDKGEEHYARLLQVDEDIRFIIVVSDITRIEQIKPPKAPYIYATIAYSEDSEPAVRFYKGGQPE